MRKPLDKRTKAFCNPMLVFCRFACALAAEMLLTTENDAM
jgi:hypothetical protein